MWFGIWLVALIVGALLIFFAGVTLGRFIESLGKKGNFILLLVSLVVGLLMVTFAAVFALVGYIPISPGA